MADAPTHAGLTADMFVVRGDRFLTLERGRGRGEGLYYLPGGIVDPGEDPLDAAVRETAEESGLHVRDARILRVWTYPTPEGFETTHATFVSWSDGGEVVLIRGDRPRICDSQAATRRVARRAHEPW